MDPSGIPAIPNEDRQSNWFTGFALAGFINSCAGFIIHSIAIIGSLFHRSLILPSTFFFERMCNWLQCGLLGVALVGFSGLWRGKWRNRWVASWALAAWIVATSYRLIVMRRFYDPEAVRLAFAFYIPLPGATLLILLFGFPGRTARLSRQEGILLFLLALAILAVALVPLWEGPFEHRRDIKGLGFSTDGTTLAATDWDGVTLWQFPSGRRIHRIKYPLCDQVTFSPDGAFLAVANEYERDLKLFSTRTWELARTINFKTPSGLNSFAYSRDGRFLAVGGEGVAIVNSSTLQKLMEREIKGTSTHKLSLTFSPDALKLAVGLYELRSAVLLKSSDGSEVWRVVFPVAVTSVCFSPDGSTVAVALISGDSGLDVGEHFNRLVRKRPERSAIVFLDAMSGREKQGAPDFDGSVHDLSFSPDGRLLGWTGGLGWVYVYDVLFGRMVLRDCFPEMLRRNHVAGSGDSIAFSPDSRHVACGGDVGRIAVWDLATGHEIGK